MIKKVAIAQGFRLAFPDELAGMPYTADEIDENEIQAEIVEQKHETNQRDYKNLLADEMKKLGATTKELRRMFANSLKENGLDVFTEEGAKEALDNLGRVKFLYQEFEKELQGEKQ